MTNNIQTPNSNKFDLEERTLSFARRVREYVSQIPYSSNSIDDIRQVIRSSGSIGANYIEANESLGPKDFFMKIRTSRKETKESRQWITLTDTDNNLLLNEERDLLINESTELLKIFSSILQKMGKNKV